jgi:hypothetical protein
LEVGKFGDMISPVENSGEERSLSKLRKSISSVQLWLDREFAVKHHPPEAVALAKTLRAYLRRCRRLLKEEKMPQRDMDRRARKIDRAFFVLWQLTRSSNR